MSADDPCGQPWRIIWPNVRDEPAAILVSANGCACFPDIPAGGSVADTQVSTCVIQALVSLTLGLSNLGTLP
jgi:hypothetical protein